MKFVKNSQKLVKEQESIYLNTLILSGALINCSLVTERSIFHKLSRTLINGNLGHSKFNSYSCILLHKLS